jgi:Tol biopolymer transport system component
VIAVAAATAAVFVWMSRRPAVVPSQTAAAAAVVVPFTTFPGIETAPSFSPDGSRIAFSWDGDSGNKTGHSKFDLYVKVIGSEKLLKLTDHPSDWIASTWSPDGTQVAFHRLDGDDTGIYVVPALGGPERKLIATHAPYDLAAPLSWSPDGKWIAYSDAAVAGTGDHNIAALLNVDTLEIRQIPRDPSCRHEGVAMFSHSGDQIAMVCVHNKDSFDYVVMDALGNGRRTIASYKAWVYGGIWTPDDKSLLVTAGSPGGGEFQEIRVSDGQIRRLKLMVGGWAAMSVDGRSLAYSVFDQRQKILRRDLKDLKAPPVEMFASTMEQNNSMYSPDGKHIVFDSRRSGDWSVWVADADGSNPVQLSRSAEAGYPQWSPDSQRIAYQQLEADGQVVVYTVDIADRTPRRLKTNLRRSSYPFWSADGKWIYLVGFDGTARQIYRCPVDGGVAASVAEVVVESNELGRPKVSPDGTKLYFTADENQLKVLDLTNPSAKPDVVQGVPPLGDDSQWVVARDGIYFAKAGNTQSIFFRDWKTGRVREILKTGKSLSEGVSISPDQRYMLFTEGDEANSDIMLVRNFQ